MGTTLRVRRAQERGHADHGWLDSWHTFSFSDYHDPEHMGFRSLRVINEDRVAPGEGFPTHPHRDMEIVTWVLDGAIEHKDSLGTGSVIRPGDAQRMTAGRGIEHSEFNHSKTEGLHFLQIWILPDRRGRDPGYEQKHFAPKTRQDVLRVVAAPDGRDGAITVHQDVTLLSGLVAPGKAVEHRLAPGRHAWVQVARGAVTLDGERLVAGDGASLSGAERVRLEATAPSEVLVFDLA